MKCKYCGSEVEEGVKFCPSCGANLQEEEKAAEVAEVVEEASATEAEVPAEAPKEKVTIAKMIFAIIGFASGLTSLICCFIPFTGIFIGIFGIVFSACGKKTNKCRGLAVAGLIISIIATVISAIITLVVIIGIIAASSDGSFMEALLEYLESAE